MGDVVKVDGYTSFCVGSSAVVSEVKTLFSPLTGKPFQLVVTPVGTFRSDTGECVVGPSMYYMVEAETVN